MKETLHFPEELRGQVWFHRNRGRLHPRHRHDELEFNLIVRGTGKYLVKDRAYDVQRNDVLWLFPDQEHILVDMSPDFSMWIAIWRPSLVKAICTGKDARILRQGDPTGRFCRRLTNPQAARLNSLCDDLFAARMETDLYNAGIAYALLAAWATYNAGDELPASAIVHPAVEQAARALRAGDATLSLTQLSKRAGLSPARLSRLFKQQLGIALVEYRNRQRLDRFLALRAADAGGNLMRLALDAGFGSYPQFHRVFTAMMACSPARFFKK